MTTMLGRCPAGGRLPVVAPARDLSARQPRAPKRRPENCRSTGGRGVSILPLAGRVLVSELLWNLILAHGVILFLVMHLKPTWLAEVSIGSA